jgi:hypothetical protein
MVGDDVIESPFDGGCKRYGVSNGTASSMSQPDHPPRFSNFEPEYLHNRSITFCKKSDMRSTRYGKYVYRILKKIQLMVELIFGYKVSDAF